MLRNLKQLRQEYHISQQRLADAVEVSQQSINQYENHNIEPDIAVLSPDRKIEGAMGYQSYTSRFEGGRYDVQSIGYQEGNAASILINGKEYSMKSRGLNIVVYSHYQDKVIDSVNFDTHVGADAVRY